MGSRGQAGKRRSSRGGRRWWQPRSPCWPCWCRPSLGKVLVANSSVGTDSHALHHTRCVTTITTALPIQQGKEERMKRFATMETTRRRGRKKTHWKLGELGLRADISTLCLDSQAQLVADPNDCHTFYHCDELSPQKQSCGDLMFNTIRMTCDWPRSVMQIRPECRDPDSFKFRLGPRSWDSRRTHRMLNWLGDGRAIARVRVPRPQLRQQQYPRYQQPAPVFRPNSVQVVDQQRRRLMDERPRVVMPSRLSVPETPLVYVE